MHSRMVKGRAHINKDKWYFNTIIFSNSSLIHDACLNLIAGSALRSLK